MNSTGDVDQAPQTPEASVQLLEALADPIRWRAYSMLVGVGAMTTAQLAKRTNVAAGVMAWHLKALVSVGFVLEQRLEGRRSTWVAVPGGVHLVGNPDEWAAGITDALAQFERVLLLCQGRALQDWASQRSSWPGEWRSASTTWDTTIRLSLDEMAELGQELEQVVDRWITKARGRPDEESGTEERRPIYVAVNAVPYPLGYE